MTKYPTCLYFSDPRLSPHRYCQIFDFQNAKERNEEGLNCSAYENNNMTKLPAPLALKKYIVQQANSMAYDEFRYDGLLETEEQIKKAYEYTINNDGYGIKDTVRSEGIETGLPTPFSRHYECETRALLTEDGWLGYNFWHGGGKFGNEEEIDFISDSYYLLCEEKEVLTIQRTWAKVEP